jgi:IclR family pca regulon transcriptional regulator
VLPTVDQPEPHPVDALSSALRIMSLFTEQRPLWRLKEIKEATALHPATAYRLLMTLTDDGYLDHLQSGEYRPGLSAATLGAAALNGQPLLEVATPALTELAERTGETVDLGALADDSVVYLLHLIGRSMIASNIQVGSTRVAAATSIGSVLLSDRGREYTAGHSPPWAIQDDESAVGLRSVAALIRDAGGSAIAAAGIVVRAPEWPAARIVVDLVPALTATCADISRDLRRRAPEPVRSAG